LEKPDPQKASEKKTDISLKIYHNYKSHQTIGIRALVREDFDAAGGQGVVLGRE
jgi:hypothetical protein